VLDCCSRLGFLISSEDGPAVETKTLADWEIICDVLLQDETSPHAQRYACGKADQGRCRLEAQGRLTT
jgi:hypothetical protein